MKRKRTNGGLFVVTLCATLFIVALLILLVKEIQENSRTAYLKVTENVEVEEKKEEPIPETKEEEQPEEKKEEKKEEPATVIPEEKVPEVRHYTTRLTSFWPAENNGENICTASGLCMQHMTENENGWYMYKGKLAIATASTRLGSSSQKTYKLFQEVTLVINGKSYPAIVIDVCGACQRRNIIDLYVKDGAHSITTTAEIYY